MMSGSTCSAKVVDGRALESLFDELFRGPQNTCLRGGAAEPLYEPVVGDAPAFISYRLDYPSSALHEIAHWCIAGSERRERVDYGYWYNADGRCGDAQQRFQAVEARPQALEWCFSQAAGVSFRLSLDNLDTPPSSADVGEFARHVIAAGEALRERGLPPRAQRFFAALCRNFNPAFSESRLRFTREQLG